MFVAVLITTFCFTPQPNAVCFDMIFSHGDCCYPPSEFVKHSVQFLMMMMMISAPP